MTVAAYLAKLPPEKRAALMKLRRAIKSVAPRAEDGISYGIPALRLDGRWLVGYGAWAKHCSFFPGARPIAVCKRDLKKYKISRGTIQFPADAPLPATLVRKLMKIRLAEHRK